MCGLFTKWIIQGHKVSGDAMLRGETECSGGA